MTDAVDPVQSAHDAAEMIRRLNHETLNADQMSAPEISRTVRHLVTLVDRLPQAFEQLAAHLAKQQANGRVRMEDGSDPAVPVNVARTRLEQAAALTEGESRITYGTPASPLNDALSEASENLFHMGGVLEPGDDGPRIAAARHPCRILARGGESAAPDERACDYP